MFETPYREHRPWGSFEQFTLDYPSTVKVITVRAGEAFSLQKHRHRDEFWHVLAGDGIIRIGDKEVPVAVGDNHSIEAGKAHRITAGTADVVVLEIATGVFDESDIIRLEDNYGRVGQA